MKRFFYLFALILVGNTALSAASFSSNVVTGNWTVGSSWTIVGFDADGTPDSDDDITINSGHTITLNATATCRTLVVSTGATLNYANRPLLIYGSTFTRAGTTLNASTMYFFGNPCTITITGTYSNGGNWNIQPGANVTIAAGGLIVKQNYIAVQNNATLTNLTALNLSGGSVNTTGTGTFINGATGTLAVARPFNGPVSNFNFTAVGNRVRYSTNNTTTILGTSYHHLDLINTTNTKTLAGSISVAGNFTIGSGCTLDCNFNSIFLGGNWLNSANITPLNQNTIIFVGSGIQTITRTPGNTETFGSFVVSGSGTVRLNDSIFVNGSLTVSAGTLDVNTNNYSIRVRANFSDDATFMARQGTVFMVGTVAQTIGGISNTNFYNLHCSNAAGVLITSFAKSLSNILTVTAGAMGTSGGGSLTLLATAPTTAARIAPLGATASLVGTDWIIQTYINGPATAYWQYLSSPINGSTIADWDGDTRFYMSGVGGNDGTACCPTFFSVRTYSEASNTYSNVTSTGTSIASGRGYMVWMADNLNSLTAPLIFDTRGLPNFNTVNRAVTAGGAGGGYNLVGNPFASPITYATVVSASSATLSSNFVILQENGSYATNPNGGTIAAGQGFMCIASAAGNITFTETAKSTTANPNVVRMLAGNEIRIKVGNEVNGLGEEAVVKLNPGGDESLNLAVDLPYLPSPYDNATHIYTQNSFGEQFLLNNLGTESDHLMVPVNIVTSTPGVQTLTFKDLNTVTEYNCAWLEDLATGAKVNLNQYDTYSFEEAEMGATRNFILHFERTNDCSFDLQNSVASLDAQTNVFVSGERIFAQFEFETEEVVTISMFDLGGRMVMGETTMNVATQTVTLENPDAHGIYLVRIQKGNEVSTKKIYY